MGLEFLSPAFSLALYRMLWHSTCSTTLVATSMNSSRFVAGTVDEIVGSHVVGDFSLYVTFLKFAAYGC
jgi:hypothetical protein